MVKIGVMLSSKNRKVECFHEKEYSRIFKCDSSVCSKYDPYMYDRERE